MKRILCVGNGIWILKLINYGVQCIAIYHYHHHHHRRRHHLSHRLGWVYHRHLHHHLQSPLLLPPLSGHHLHLLVYQPRITYTDIRQHRYLCTGNSGNKLNMFKILLQFWQKVQFMVLFCKSVCMHVCLYAEYFKM